MNETGADGGGMPGACDVARSYWASRIVLSAAELDLCGKLATRPAGAEELAAREGWDARALARLLDAMVALGFLAKAGGEYSPTAAGESLDPSGARAELPMLLHLATLWESWGGLTDTVRSGRNPRRVTREAMGKERRDAFIGAMHVVGRDLAEEIARGYDAGGCRHLLDVGGASGTYTAAFLGANPGMRATLFDLPDVIPLARERLAAGGLADRVTLVGGDCAADELPGGCDLAFVSAVVHMLGRGECAALYAKVFRALEPGGRILIRDHVMDEDRTWPRPGAIFAVNMLVGTDAGDCYTFEEMREDLAGAGFERVTWVRRGERMDSLIEGCKPGA